MQREREREKVGCCGVRACGGGAEGEGAEESVCLPIVVLFVCVTCVLVVVVVVVVGSVSVEREGWKKSRRLALLNPTRKFFRSNSELPEHDSKTEDPRLGPTRAPSISEPRATVHYGASSFDTTSISKQWCQQEASGYGLPEPRLLVPGWNCPGRLHGENNERLPFPRSVHNGLFGCRCDFFENHNGERNPQGRTRLCWDTSPALIRTTGCLVLFVQLSWSDGISEHAPLVR